MMHLVTLVPVIPEPVKSKLERPFLQAQSTHRFMRAAPVP
jgi:hypothetical protein